MSSWGFNVGAQQIASASLHQSQPSQPTLSSASTKYSELEKQNPQLKQEIDQIYSLCKQPMRDGLDEISKSRGTVSDKIAIELKQIQLAALKFENVLDRLRKETEVFREISKEQHRDAQIYGRNGIQQIKYRGGVISSVSYTAQEDLPIPFYYKAIHKLEKRFDACYEEIQLFSQQMKTISDTLTNTSSNINQYGKRDNKVGAEQIVQLIQIQYTAFIRLAAVVADINSQTEILKSKYLTIFHEKRYKSVADKQHTLNPFEKADRDEEIKQKRMQQKLQIDLTGSSSSSSSTRGQPQQQGQMVQGIQGQQQNQLTNSAAFGAPAGGGFGAPAGGGFGAPAAGGFGAPAAGGGFGAPAGGGFGAPAAGGFGAAGGGFGAPAAGGGFGAPAAGGGFGAPAGGGFGAPAGGGFGAPAGGGFGAPAGGGFGAPAAGGGFGAPAGGGFGAPAAGGGFGAPAGGGFGAPAIGGGFGAPAAGGFGSPSSGMVRTSSMTFGGFGQPQSSTIAGLDLTSDTRSRSKGKKK